MQAAPSSGMNRHNAGSAAPLRTRCAALLSALCAVSAVWLPTASADAIPDAELISECASAADADTEGLSALEASCRGVTEALGKSGYLSYLSPQQQAELRPDQLEELAQLMRQYERPAVGPAVDASALRPILDELRSQHTERRVGWMERLRRWLRQLIERQRQEPDSWLARWLEDLDVPDRVSRAILFGSILLIVALALAVVINELRVAGAFRRRRAAARADVAAGEAGATATFMAGARGEPASAAKAPLLLRALVTTLQAGGRLPEPRCLTHTELGLRATFDDEQQRRCFQRVARLAERVTYSTQTIPPGEIDEILTAGRALNSQLSGAGK
jgi:hypothetical protein